jgi:hypothetical protein
MSKLEVAILPPFLVGTSLSMMDRLFPLILQCLFLLFLLCPLRPDVTLFLLRTLSELEVAMVSLRLFMGGTALSGRKRGCESSPDLETNDFWSNVGVLG